jgi:hypothetical protein
VAVAVLRARAFRGSRGALPEAAGERRHFDDDIPTLPDSSDSANASASAVPFDHCLGIRAATHRRLPLEGAWTYVARPASATRELAPFQAFATGGTLQVEVLLEREPALAIRAWA